MTVALEDHPAKFSDSVLDAVKPYLRSGDLVLDPFAGTGRVHELEDFVGLTIGVELEPEWAGYHPRTIVGNSLYLPMWWSGLFDCVVTSPVYGNRMSDHYNAQERCKACRGTGETGVAGGGIWVTWGDPCPKCDGSGRRNHTRMNYRSKLGRPVTEGSSCKLKWGPRYRAFHEGAWMVVRRVLREPTPGRSLPRFILNVKDFVADHEMVHVSHWHRKTVLDLGFRLVAEDRVRTPGMRHGRNHDARDECEWVMVFEKEAA